MCEKNFLLKRKKGKNKSEIKKDGASESLDHRVKGKQQEEKLDNMHEKSSRRAENPSV